MAFQQPQQRPQVARQLSTPKTINDIQTPASPTRKRYLEESQEWILFSPAQNADSASQVSRTSQTPRTATHRSDFGSLETHVRSQPLNCSIDEGEATCLGTEVDDTAELDSLDDGLRAFDHDPFHSSPYLLDQSGGTLLPTHDGLGEFTSSTGLQEQLWQFERHNPHRKRHVRRRSSLQRRIDEIAEEQERDPEDERVARIEKWRLEQSKAVLEEIEREARRRRRRMSRMSDVAGSVDVRSTLHESGLAQAAPRQDSIIYEEQEMVESGEQVEDRSESWWQRITRRVIQDLIGLDENTLSVIFGEELADDPSPTPTQPSPIAAAVAAESKVTFRDQDHSWETKLMQRIARELGILMHQLSDHEGAFSTYQRIREESEYAGLPIQRDANEKKLPALRQQRRKLSHREGKQPVSESLFEPTLPRMPASPTEVTDTSLWGIEEEPNDAGAGTTHSTQEREYWEQDIDANIIFSYLKRRFTSSQPPTNNTTSNSGPLPASWASSALGTSTDSVRRAEQIRRQHPLVSRAAERAATQSKRRESLLKKHQMQTLMQRRTGSSSCASQSTKRSRRSKSGDSSRHYWDLGPSGGSVGSGGAFSSSALGGWGEV